MDEFNVTPKTPTDEFNPFATADAYMCQYFHCHINDTLVAKGLIPGYFILVISRLDAVNNYHLGHISSLQQMMATAINGNQQVLSVTSTQQVSLEIHNDRFIADEISLHFCEIL